MFDVSVDVQKNSSSYLSWVGFELTDENRTALYIPQGFAQVFQTLSDETEVISLISEPFMPDAAIGFSFDDPKIEIDWPLPHRSYRTKTDHSHCSEEGKPLFNAVA